MIESREVVILSAARTAIGTYGGALKDVPPTDLGAHVVKESVQRASVDPAQIETCVLGSVVRTEPKDAYISRLVAVNGGLPVETQCVTVNRLCGSGLEAIVFATQQIQLGEVDTAVAGGAESMSKATYSMPAVRWGARMGDVQAFDEMTAALHDPFGHGHMGITAENIAERFDISRETQDTFAAESHRRALNAIEQGYFKDQITPFEIKTRKGVVTFDTDEHPRPGTSVDSLSGLRPVFKKEGGTVTAGNASGINDGAAMVVLMERSKAEAEGRTPMARIVSYARAGVEPEIMGTGPIPAVKRALARANLSIDQIDVIESNEAFAAQAYCVSQELGFPPEKTNPNGGAVALGHPIGATGAILTTKCLYELKRTGGRYGLITLCIGGGQGIAAIIEAL